MDYRKAELSDAEILAQMRVAMLREHADHPAELMARVRSNTQKYIAGGIQDNSLVSWVAVQDGRIVATSVINFFTLPPNDWCPGGKTAYIGNIYTLPALRKRGVASRLLARLIDEAKSRNCERILLNTTDMGRSLYEKCGFDVSTTAMAFYPFGIIPGE